jgi:excisionase family DNA binding protein
MALEELLTVEEVAGRLKVHPETVRRWLREGRLDGYRISRKGGWRVRPESITRMLEEGLMYEGKELAA